MALHLIAKMLNAYRIRASRKCTWQQDVVPEPEQYRVVVLGDGAVGKTSLLKRFFYDRHETRHILTIEDLYLEKLKVEDNHIELQIIDCAGTENFPAMRRLAVQRADAIIIVYALDNADSFVELQRLRDEIAEIREVIPPVILVGNKSDTCCDETPEQKQLRCDAIENKFHHQYVECSARDGTNVAEIFETCLFSELYKGHCDKESERKSSRCGPRGLLKKIRKHLSSKRRS